MIGFYAASIISRAQRACEQQVLQDPIDDADFLFAANVLSPQGSNTLLMGEYILLQLLRTGQTSED